MKAPKKPSLKALPKQPKQNASEVAWKNYESKLKAVETENKKIIAEYRKKKAAYDAEIKKRDAIKAKAQKVKSLSGF